MAKKYFGTDGIRGKVGEHPITPEFVMRLGYAAGRVFVGLQQCSLAKGAHPTVYRWNSRNCASGYRDFRITQSI